MVIALTSLILGVLIGAYLGFTGCEASHLQESHEIHIPPSVGTAFEQAGEHAAKGENCFSGGIWFKPRADGLCYGEDVGQLKALQYRKQP